MADTSDFRNGLCIEYNNDIFSIVEFQHVKPGKGGAFVRTKLKSITTGKVIENTFNAGAKVNTARIERRPHQYLYKDDLGYHFMDTESFDQYTLQEEQINAPEFLMDGQEVELIVHDETEKVLGCELPQFVHLVISYTEPGVKGDTATNATKPATLESGATINVPLFINEGEKLKIDTRKKAYVERVKE